MDIHGNCGAPFEKVRHNFLQHFEKDQEKGAALAIWYQGELVVNLWAGTRNKEQTEPWTEQTIVNVFSTSKMISAICVQHAMDEGALDLARPVKDYWPEYNCEGKGDTSMAWLLNHRAGLPALRDPVPGEALFDWDFMCQRLAKETPWWKPGDQHGYHMVTFGWLVGEVFKRATGVTIGQYLKEQIADPYQLDMAMGFDESRYDVADLFGATSAPEGRRIHLFNEVLANSQGMTAKALSNPPTLLTSSNKPEWRLWNCLPQIVTVAQHL